MVDTDGTLDARRARATSASQLDLVESLDQRLDQIDARLRGTRVGRDPGTDTVPSTLSEKWKRAQQDREDPWKARLEHQVLDPAPVASDLPASVQIPKPGAAPATAGHAPAVTPDEVIARWKAHLKARQAGTNAPAPAPIDWVSPAAASAASIPPRKTAAQVETDGTRILEAWKKHLQVMKTSPRKFKEVRFF